MKLNLLPEILLLSLFLHYKVKKNQKRMKERSFGTPHGFLTFLLTLSLRMTPIGVFPDDLNFSHFSATSCCFKKKKSKFIKFCTKFYIKQATFLPSKWNSFLLRSKRVQQNHLHFFKN